jgi:hypothetical protein
MTEISAEVKGDDGFYFWEGRKFGALAPEQLAMVAEFLGEIAALAQDLAQRGVPGDLKATLAQTGIPGVQNALVVEGFSKEDMTKFQHRFSNGWDRLIDKFSDRRKGKGKK